MIKNLTVTQNFKTLQGMLIKSIPQLKIALPKHLDAEKIARIALTEVRKNDYLLSCDPRSFIGALMTASQLGLEIGSDLGQAYLVPFFNKKSKSNECQFILGYRGMIMLARQSGKVVSITAQCVYEKDHFEFEYGIDEKLKHIPIFEGDRGKFIGAYCIVKLTDGGYQFVFVPAEKIQKIKTEQLDKITNDYAKKYSPWMSCFDEMAAKTAVRRLFKFLPVSTEIQRAVTLDEQADRGEQKNYLEDSLNIDDIRLENNIDEIIEENPQANINNIADKINSIN